MWIHVCIIRYELFVCHSLMDDSLMSVKYDTVELTSCNERSLNLLNFISKFIHYLKWYYSLLMVFIMALSMVFKG